MDNIKREEIIKFLIQNLTKKQLKTGMNTVSTPIEHAQAQQQKRAKERHEYLLRDYEV